MAGNIVIDLVKSDNLCFPMFPIGDFTHPSQLSTFPSVKAG
ncbi:hypothetical protein FDUTEX481_03370 [Tolypothrix sp. PCC 7601]|nr:hypothetical protein FDUTEX481_03370 [Tolypothrix sp. PCC 7601]